MIIRSLIINNLRNHAHSQLNFCDGVNVLYGPNGAGKTTVLEALTICAFTKTFLPTSDSEIVSRGSENYSLSCEAQTDLGNTYKISISAGITERKTISSTRGNSLSPREVIGEIPMTVLSPDFKNITFGSPSDRRAFLDRLLSQCSKRYLEELAKLRRVLKQRNFLLGARGGYLDRAQLSVWTEELLLSSAEITARRRDFVRDFIPFFQEAYSTLSLGQEDVSIQYVPDLEIDSDVFATLGKESIDQQYRQYSVTVEDEELRRGLTMFGPQKDELEILVNGGRARESASQGQHKSLLICLKKAEFEYLKTVRSETPVLLLDDIFSELDEQRTSRVFETVIASAKQCFITTTEVDRIKTKLSDLHDIRFFRAESGKFQQ